MKIISNPIAAFRDTPVTYIMAYSVSMMSAWLGVVILSTTVKLPPERLAGYAGPLSVMSLQHWGWWFVLGGIAGALRPFFHHAPRIELLLHLVKMMALMAWALAFDFGGTPTTGQASYTFLALISFLTPYLPLMIERRYGARPPIPGHRRGGF